MKSLIAAGVGRGVLLALLAVVMVAGCKESPSEPSSGTFGDIEQSVHRKVNEYRASKGLAALTFDENIAAQARTHSREMAAGRRPFSHDGFDERVTAINGLMHVQAAAENVAFNNGFADPAAEAVDDWINSADHRTNIEGGYNATGIGVGKGADGAYYFTQLFIQR